MAKMIKNPVELKIMIASIFGSLVINPELIDAAVRFLLPLGSYVTWYFLKKWLDKRSKKNQDGEDKS